MQPCVSCRATAVAASEWMEKGTFWSRGLILRLPGDQVICLNSCVFRTKWQVLRVVCILSDGCLWYSAKAHVGRASGPVSTGLYAVSCKILPPAVGCLTRSFLRLFFPSDYSAAPRCPCDGLGRRRRAQYTNFLQVSKQAARAISKDEGEESRQLAGRSDLLVLVGLGAAPSAAATTDAKTKSQPTATFVLVGFVIVSFAGLCGSAVVCTPMSIATWKPGGDTVPMVPVGSVGRTRPLV